MTNKVEAGHQDWVDFSKGLVILLVVAGHTLSKDTIIWKFIFAFHMPFFFFIAGYLFRYKKGFLSFAKKKIFRLLLPYYAAGLFLLIFYPLLLKLFYSFSGQDYDWGQYAPANILLSVAYGAGRIPDQLPDLYTVGALWFLPCMFAFVVVLWLIIRLYDLQWVSIWLVAALSILIAAVGVFLGKMITPPLSFDVALVMLPFALAGWIFRKYDIFGRLSSKWGGCLLILMSALYSISAFQGGIDINNRQYFGRGWGYSGAFCGSVVIAFICYRFYVKNAFTRSISLMGRYSLEYLCFHVIQNSFLPWKISYEYCGQYVTLLFKWILLWINLKLYLLAVKRMKREQRA